MGHTAECQLHFTPKHVKGAGMNGGEQVETVWSLMNRYVPTLRHVSIFLACFCCLNCFVTSIIVDDKGEVH